jgi:DNA repair exonuclease SbcCD ATPase subunit
VLLDIEMSGFCHFADFKLQIKDAGLVWVSGVNNETAAATSNGAGKSSLFKAVSWTLYGKTLDAERADDPGDDVLCKFGKSKPAIGIASLDSGWKIRRERRKGAPKCYLIQPSGERWDGSKTEVQSKIDELLGCDFASFRNTVLHGANDDKRFASPKTTDAERKAILHRVLRTDVLATCAKLSKLSSMEAGAKVAELEAKKDTIQTLIDAVSLADLRERSSAWASERDADVAALRAKTRKMIERASEVTSLEQKIAELERELSKAEKAQDAARAAKDALRQARADRDEAHERHSEAKSNHRKHKDRLASLKSDRAEKDADACPTCESPMKEGATPETRAMLRRMDKAITTAEGEEITAASKSARTLDKLEAAEAALEAAEAAAATADEAIGEIRRINRALAEAKDDLADVRVIGAEAQGIVERAKARRDEINPYDGQIADARARLKGLKTKMDALMAELEPAREEKALADFWSVGYGTAGVPSFVLDNVMGYLSERANHHLETLADGDIEMEFSTQRALASGKGAKDEINISWVIEGVPGTRPSGGQWRKMEIATDLALLDLSESQDGGKLNLFMADEILDGLDAEGTQRVAQILHDIRAKRGAVFVIAHGPDMAEHFERSITITKTGKVATLETDW